MSLCITPQIALDNVQKWPHLEQPHDHVQQQTSGSYTNNTWDNIQSSFWISSRIQLSRSAPKKSPNYIQSRLWITFGASGSRPGEPLDHVLKSLQINVREILGSLLEEPLNNVLMSLWKTFKEASKSHLEEPLDHIQTTLWIMLIGSRSRPF